MDERDKQYFRRLRRQLQEEYRPFRDVLDPPQEASMVDSEEFVSRKAIRTRPLFVETELGRAQILISKDEHNEWVWLIRYLEATKATWVQVRLSQEGELVTKSDITRIAKEYAHERVDKGNDDGSSVR